MPDSRGEDPTVPGYKEHKVEVLGNGQQCVAFGIHPHTGLPYDWYDWPSTGPLDTRRSDLPMVTEDLRHAAIWIPPRRS